MSRPRYDSRVLAPGAPEREPRSQADVLPPSAGSATAGYHSAKYTPAEWFSNYHSILQQAGADRVAARSVQRESKTLKQDSEADTLQIQADGTRQLGERLQDIHLLKSELQQMIDQLLADTGALMALKKRLEKALDATEIPCAIATDNLNCRSRRPAPDLVRDPVEEELLKVGPMDGGLCCSVRSRLCLNAHDRPVERLVDLLWFLDGVQPLGQKGLLQFFKKSPECPFDLFQAEEKRSTVQNLMV